MLKTLDNVKEPTESRKAWLLMIFEHSAKQHKRNNKYQLWTHENHAIELYSNEMIDQRMNYIHMNPVRAGIVENSEDYLYSSARNYADMDFVLEVDLING